MKARILPALALAATVGCGWSDIFGSNELDRLHRERGKWAALGIKNYDFDFQQSVFWFPEMNAPVTISVRSDTVWQVRNRLTDEIVPPSEYGRWPTINDVFASLVHWARENPEHVVITYDANYHYPNYSQGDIPMMADEEFTQRITRFALLPIATSLRAKP